MYSSFLGLIGLVGLLLGLWVVLPAPTTALLPLAIGAPEISPWLVLFNLVGVGLGLGNEVYRGGPWVSRAVLLGCVAGLVLSALPLMQVGVAQQAAERAMANGLGVQSTARLAVMQPLGRSHPFRFLDTLRGIPLHADAVRYTADIPVAEVAGVPLTLDVYQPPLALDAPADGFPGLVMVYGGAWRAGSPADNATFARYMAARGYVVWAIAYRHAPQFQFPAQLEDVQTALAFVLRYARDYDTDPNRLALMGRSAGAHLAMLAAYQPDAPPLRAVVNYYGPVDLLRGYTELPQPDPLDVRAILEDFLGGAPDESAIALGEETVSDRYRAASPIHYITPTLPPTLLIYGGKDRIVLPQFGRAMAAQLQASGSPTVLIELPWADHAFDAVFQGVSNQLALYYTERFLAWTLR
ncbi:MAG: alpha/beta hydrolase [Kaiparowitsia implicata GSE-PSE-MK54-09C]|nr:alpha/beta hydrolase [Kaiparowitsia implicata GSE-PSE-MK54-09C]